MNTPAFTEDSNEILLLGCESKPSYPSVHSQIAGIYGQVTSEIQYIP
jgi:hypothetical protein